MVGIRKARKDKLKKE